MDAKLPEIEKKTDPTAVGGRSVEDYIKENEWLNAELKSVREKCRKAESQLEQERKLQDSKLGELALNLLEFEEHLRKEQRKVRNLLKAKHKALQEKQCMIESLQRQVDLLEAGLKSVSSPGVDIKFDHSDSVCSPEVEQDELNPSLNELSQKRRDLSHLLYLDLNTDQLGGRRFFRHRDLSPVAEVREDLDEFLASPARTTPRNLLPNIGSNSPSAKPKLFQFEPEPDDKTVTSDIGCGSSHSLPVSVAQVASKDTSCDLKEASSPSSLYRMNADMLNLSDITDKDSDVMRTIMMCDVDNGILADGILNSSFEDHVMSITSHPMSRDRETFGSSSSDDTTHLAKAQKEIRRSLIFDDVDEVDEKDEFYDCPTPKSMLSRERRNVGSKLIGEMTCTQPRDLQEKESECTDKGLSGMEVDHENSIVKGVSDSLVSLPQDVVQGLIHCHSLLRTDSPDSGSNTSVKEEWSDAREMMSCPVSRGSSFEKDTLDHDDGPDEALETVTKNCDSATSDIKIENAMQGKQPIGSNGSPELNGVLSSGQSNDKLLAPSRKHNKKQNGETKGEEELDEYDVIEMDVDTKL